MPVKYGSAPATPVVVRHPDDLDPNTLYRDAKGRLILVVTATHSVIFDAERIKSVSNTRGTTNHAFPLVRLPVGHTVTITQG